MKLRLFPYLVLVKIGGTPDRRRKKPQEVLVGMGGGPKEEEHGVRPDVPG